MTQHLSPLRKIQTVYLAQAAAQGQIVGGKGKPKLQVLRALVRKGYLTGSLTDKSDEVVFTITPAGREALDPLHDYVTLAPDTVDWQASFETLMDSANHQADEFNRLLTEEHHKRQQAEAEAERLKSVLQEIADYYITPREASVSDIRVLRDMARQGLKTK